VFLLGNWKNFEDLEESLSLQELDLILKHKRESERNQQKFLAAIQGIDLSKNDKNEVQERLDEVRRRVAEHNLGEEEATRQEFAAIGLGFETVD
jgi:hypothetical protein